MREGIDAASEVTFAQNLAQVPSSRAFAMAEMAAAGVKFYVPTKDELAQWAERAGHQNAEWTPWKIKLAGSISVFDQMLEAANTRGRYYVNDV